MPVGEPYSPYFPAGYATAPTGAPSKQAASVAIDLPDKPDFYDGKECEGYFADLNDVDRKEVCDVLTDTDTQLTELVGAINGYVQALVGREAALQKQLNELLAQAEAEDAATGSVSAETEEAIEATEAALDTTGAELAELRKKVAGYSKLPGVIGEYNKYFEALRTAIQAKTSIPVASAAPGGLPPGGAAMDFVPSAPPDATSVPVGPYTPVSERESAAPSVRAGPEAGFRRGQDDIEQGSREARQAALELKRSQSALKELAQAVGATNPQQLRAVVNRAAATTDDEQKLVAYVNALNIDDTQKNVILGAPVDTKTKLDAVKLFTVVRLYPDESTPTLQRVVALFQTTFGETLDTGRAQNLLGDWALARAQMAGQPILVPPQ